MFTLTALKNPATIEDIANETHGDNMFHESNPSD